MVIESGVQKLEIVSSPDWQDYELLDSGHGKKLERFGQFILTRPEAEAIWSPMLKDDEWKKASAVFNTSAEEMGGHWNIKSILPEFWSISYKHLTLNIRTTASRHVGVFPEQACHWDWIAQRVQQSQRTLKVLNLFGYTGLATLAAAASGAEVTHLDASRKVVNWGKENQLLSGLQEYPIRWLVDDAMKFVQREGRRGSLYDGIIIDPPKFGRGPKGEVWEFYRLLPELLRNIKSILTNPPAFVIIHAYAVKASSITLYYSLKELCSGFDGEISAGETVLEEKSGKRLLSTSVFARWTAS